RSSIPARSAPWTTGWQSSWRLTKLLIPIPSRPLPSPYGRQKRPRLRGLNDEELVAFMEQDMALREPYYGKAQQILPCEGMSDEEIIDAIIAFEE
ncbi:MAG: hypothetical protein IIX12_05205, partial [Alistipes sp.]|nr:hypothetical protein [Alistipes sp.]